MNTPALWLPRHVEGLSQGQYSCAPLIRETDIRPVADDLGVWDAWPVQERDGRPWRLEGGAELWMALAAPRFDDPDERHGHARIHLFLRNGAGWRHLGPAMPDGFSPGSREWSGSAVIDPDECILTLYFTAAGRRSQEVSFEQRIFAAEARVLQDSGGIACVNWRKLREVISRDPAHYMATEGSLGTIGTIKAFRDPAYFRDPADGRHYLFFSGSRPGSESAFNGVIGAAVAREGIATGWQILPPILSADGLNNELERPHVIHYDGLYYLFWSTQAHVFNPQGPSGPTGLYGMVSARLLDGWEPLNGTGLVFANPPDAPAQAYSWWVMPDLSVTSFVDQWGEDAPAAAPRRFGGTFAPFLELRLRSSSAALEG